MGFLRFGQQYGTFRMHCDEAAYGLDYLRAICKFDRMPLAPGEEVETVPLYVNVADAPAPALEEYADLAARNQPIAKSMTTRVAVGWGTWDYFFNNITEDDILENRWLRASRAASGGIYSACARSAVRGGEPNGFRMVCWLAEIKLASSRVFGFAHSWWQSPGAFIRNTRIGSSGIAWEADNT